MKYWSNEQNDEDEVDEVDVGSPSSSWMKYIFKMWSTSFIHHSEVVHWSSSQMNDTSLLTTTYSQNFHLWVSENPHAFMETRLYPLKIGEWYCELES